MDAQINLPRLRIVDPPFFRLIVSVASANSAASTTAMTSDRRASASWLPSDLIEWHSQCSIVVENWLYIDGGEIWANSLTDGGVEYMSFTLSISLTSSWTTTIVAAVAYPYPDSIVNDMLTRHPTLWFDPVKKSVYRFGGWPYSNSPVAVFSFLINDQGSVNWTEGYTGGILQQSSTASFSGFTNPAYAPFTYSPAAYYSLGGLMTGTSDPGLEGLGHSSQPLEGLVEYRFNELQWSNSTSKTYGGTIFGGNTGFAVAGESLYVPIFGAEGILIFIGGDAPTTQEIWTEGASLVPMNQVTVYDIQSQTFYLQNAEGTVPSPRTNFCAVGAGSAENSTWEIFVYGGNHPGTTVDYGADTNFGLDKVYVLTLPAFQWMEVPGTSGTTRSNHHCQVIGHRQMLSIGGQALTHNLSAPDPWTNGLGIFDMSDLTWSFNYDANAAAYTPASLVSDYYNTSNRYPPFNDAALEVIFNNTPASSTATTVTATNTAVANTTVATSSAANHSGSKPWQTRAIVGGLVGVVAIVALLAVLWYVFWMRLKQRNKHQGNNAGNIETRPDHSLKMNVGFLPEMDEQRQLSEMDDQRVHSELP